ncbi:MAG: type IV secretory system conjugative DNA transfer family protein [Desulfovibrionaceae bacterium]|nr:type IV secretory system conjugative DNA transfer family protein [Desulfovibrionaceae bacterium]
MGHMVGYLAASSETKQQQREKAPHEYLLRFDSNNGISFEDARHHILVMGTTGSGKTASVVLPALFRLIEAGHSGVVIDVKGNLREQAHAFARQCGRAGDLIEFGSAPSATPLNLLCGMSMSVVRDLLQTLTMSHFQGASGNKDFHMKGVHQAGDCVQLLRYLTALDEAFGPTLSMVAAMVNDYTLSNGLFKLFKNAVFDKDNAEQRMFLQRVTSNEHHIFNYDAQKVEKSKNTYLEQITYNMMGIRTALTDFLETPGIARGFAAQGRYGMDMRGLLEQNKLVLLRFAPDTGPVGASLARMLLREYYKAVYATGLTMPEGQYSFACLDEFQDFAELGAGRFSDSNFIAQAREFHAIFLASTQSMAALANRGNSLAAVHSFVSNCNARVLFYSDDPLTQSMAAQYDESMRLNALRSGEAFVIQYDTERRNHSFGLETLQQSYETTQDILRQTEAACHDTVLEAETGPSLFELLEHNEAGHTAAMQRQADESPLKGSASSSADEEPSFIGGAESRSLGQGPRLEGTGGSGQAQSEEYQEDSESRKGAELLRQSFPQFFPEDGQVHMAVPIGWLAYAEKVFRAFAESGFKLTISAIIEKGGALVVSAAESKEKQGSLAYYRQTSVRIMNALLRGTRELCPLCGSPTLKPQCRSPKFWNDDGGSELSVCDGCLAKFGLLLPGADAIEE